MTLNRELWSRARPLFEELVELDSSGRQARLDEISRLDPSLGRTLESLLRADATDEDPLRGYSFAPPRQESTLRPTDACDPLGVIGSIVSHFRVTGYLAAGGMGVVYRAEDLQLARTVALKFPLPHQQIGEEAKQRFLREARAAAVLDHPNLCSLHEIGESAHGVFLAMPLYAGETLKDRMSRDHTLPVSDAIGMIRQITTGLAFAHAAGIVHRDLKPANIMLLPNGSVKILDFGLAKVRDVSQTKSHVTLGTVAYMAPEQIRGEPADARADLWAIGVIMYEMLTGVPPFRGDHELALLHGILHAEPNRPSRLNSNIPRRLEQLLMALLQKDRSHRYGSAEALLSDLDALETGVALAHRIPIWTRAWQRKQVRIVLLAGAVAFGLLMFGALSWRLGEWNRTSAEAAPAVSQTLAVLPFANRQPRSTAEYLVSGFADGIVSRLSIARDLRIAGRFSASALQGQGLAARAVGERLQVAHVLEGGVQVEAQTLQAFVQLTRVSDDVILWSRDFKAPLSEMLALQQQVADSILGVLQLRSGQPARLPTNDTYAYDLYLKARYAWEGRTRDKMEEALAYYRGAVGRDPQFALAYAAMAQGYVNMQNFRHVPRSEGLALADAASAKAIAIDTMLAESYTARGQLLSSRGDYVEAEASFRRAIELEPSDPWARHYYALLLTMLGRFAEAKEETRRTISFDPLSVAGHSNLGIFLANEGKLDEARAQFDRARRLGPTYIVTLYYFGAYESAQGNYQEAAELLEQALEIAPNFTGVRGALAYTYERLGRSADARRMLTEARARATANRSPVDEGSRTDYALALAIAGNFDSAFAMLRTSRWDIPTLIDLRADPLLQSFRSDPRYPELLARSGLKP